MKAILDSFSPLPARAAGPAQKNFSIYKISADRGEKILRVDEAKYSAHLHTLMRASRSHERQDPALMSAGEQLPASSSAQCQEGPPAVPRQRDL